MKRGRPSATTINTIDVPSIDDFAPKITAHGGKSSNLKLQYQVLATLPIVKILRVTSALWRVTSPPSND